MPKLRFDFSMCVSIEMILVFIIVLCTVLQLPSSIISICFAISFLVLIAYLALRTKNRRFDIVTMATVILTVVCVMINYAISSEARGGFNYFKKMFMFASFCISMYLFSEDTVSERCMVLVRRLPFLAALITVLLYYSGINRIMLGRALTLGFTNPNFTGLWLLHLFIFCALVVIEKRSSIAIRGVAVALLPALANLILLTEARSCLIGMVAFFGFCVLFQMGHTSMRFKKLMIFGAIIFPLVFAFAYNSLIENEMVMSLFSSMESEGKSLTSREGVWGRAFEAVLKSPLWGDYSGISNGTGGSQLHNSHIDVLASYGMIVAGLFIALLMRQANKVIESHTTLYQNCAISGFLAVIMASTFEAAVVSGAMGMNLLTVALILLANQRQYNIT